MQVPVRLPFSLFLGLRYFIPKRPFLAVITFISLGGVILGIVLLVLVIGVMRGFDSELKKKITGWEAHVTISSADLIGDWRGIAEKIRKVPGVTGVSPTTMGPVIAEVYNFRMAPKILGIDPQMDEPIHHLSKNIIAGEARLDGESAIVGKELAESLGVTVGDKITLYSPRNLNQLFEALNSAEKGGDKVKSLAEIKELVLPTEVEVTGIFSSGRHPIDSEFMVVPLFLGQELYNLEDAVHSIGVSIDDPYRADAVRDEIAKIVNIDEANYYYVRSWIDLNQHFFDAVAMERNVIFFLLLFVVIVAAFSIMNTLITVTVLKTREIGILKAIGAKVNQIVWVFLFQGIMVGILGNVLGVGLGLTLLHYRNPFKDWLANVLHVELFPARVYQFSQLPADLKPSDLILICSISFVICALAALCPAFVAAKLDPVKALRYE